MSYASDDLPWWFRVFLYLVYGWKYIASVVVGGGLVWLLIVLF